MVRTSPDRQVQEADPGVRHAGQNTASNGCPTRCSARPTPPVPSPPAPTIPPAGRRNPRHAPSRPRGRETGRAAHAAGCRLGAVPVSEPTLDTCHAEPFRRADCESSPRGRRDRATAPGANEVEGMATVARNSMGDVPRRGSGWRRIAGRLIPRSGAVRCEALGGANGAHDIHYRASLTSCLGNYITAARD